MSELTAAEILFPGLPAEHERPTVAQPAAAQPQPAATAQAAAQAPAENDAQRIERLFGDPSKPAPAAAEAKPVAAEGQPAALPDWIDTSHPEAGAVTPVIQELGLNRDQTAKLLELRQTLAAQEIARNESTWSAEAMKLPPDVLKDAKQAVDQFGDAELNKLLNDTGMGSHPAVIRAFARALRSNPYRR
jgi:hypothetical protein